MEQVTTSVGEQLISLNGVASKLDVSPRTISRLVDAGKFPRPIKVGALNRWRQSSVDAFIEEREEVGHE